MANRSVHICEKGPVRSLNADALLVDDLRGFYAIADGVGSTDESARASNFVVNQAHQIYAKGYDSNATFDLTSVAGKVIDRYATVFGSEGAPSTTLTMLSISKSSAAYINIGDCPIFLLDGSRTSLLTKEHTAIDNKRIFSDFTIMKSFNGSNILINTIGSSRPNLIRYDDIPINLPVRFLLCSDGLLDFVTQGELGEMNSQCHSLAAFSALIQKRARDRPPRDNYSVVIVDVSLDGVAHA